MENNPFYINASAELMAIRLSLTLNTSPTVWMNLQRDYDLWKMKKLRSTLLVKKLMDAT